MKNIAVLGIGQIGTLVAKLLAKTKLYTVYAINKTDITAENSIFIKCNINNTEEFKKILLEHKIEALISCLPFFANKTVAQTARDLNLHYFDVTEDVKATEFIKQLSTGATKAFVPQCGLAPGFIEIVARNLASTFEELDTIKMRVGALPIASSNALGYLFSWSIPGVINEYCELCHAIINGKPTLLQPLEGLESIHINGTCYECFNTSGGLGSMIDIYSEKVQHLTYKTIRYPGHCNLLKFLINDLKLRDDRKTLQSILENAIPRTSQDIVLIYVSIIGKKHGVFQEEHYTKKIYGKNIDNKSYTAIQVTTAASFCAVINKVLQSPENYTGFIAQEKFTLADILDSPFGYCFT